MCRLWLFLILIGSAANAQAQTCGEQLERQAGQLAKIRTQLVQPPIEEMQTSIAEDTRLALDRLKPVLGELIASYLVCQPTSADAASIAAGLLALTAVPQMEHVEHPYAGPIGFEVKAIDDKHPLLAVVAQFQIQCGSDALLAVFEASASGWTERLRWHSPSYAEVSGAFGAFQYAIAPADARGAWYVATSHVKPWCSSTWSMIDYEVLRPTSIPTEPRVLLQDSRSMWWGSDDFGSLSAERDEFELRYTAASVDSDVHSRVYLRRYSVVGDTLTRIQPVAESPRDFVDEWSQSEWSEASSWTAPQARDRLQAVHAQLGQGADRRVSFTFGSLKSCAKGSEEVQVEVRNERDNATWYFHVHGQHEFWMETIGSEPDPRCLIDLMVPAE